MAVVTHTAEAPGFIRVTVRGPWPSIKEMRQLWTGLIRTGHLTVETRALIDIRYVDSTPHYGEVREIVAAALEHSAWPLRRAYLVGSAVQFGLARQMQAMAPPPMQLQVFSVEREALQWLSE